jgi:putative membrane protein
MRKQLLLCAVGVLASSALAGCEPYYYGPGYYGYGGYQYPYYGYGAYGAYPPPPAAYAAPQYPMPPSAVPQPPSQTSGNFATDMAMSARYEIESAQLAAERGASPQIRQFATRIIAGNAALNRDLLTAMQRSGAPVMPTPALDQAHQALIGDLNAVQGPEFDRRYATQQVMAHRETIATLQNYIQTGDNPALRQFALQTLPAAQAGLQLAERLPGAAMAYTGPIYPEICPKGVLWPFVREPGDCPTDVERFSPYR